MKVALAGLSLSGKTTLFDALSHHAVDSAAHPARADHPNVAAVKVHDERVDWLARLTGSAKATHLSMELLDLPGIVLGDGPGSADRPRIIAHMRQADAIVYCLRAFQSQAVPPPKGSVDPKRDYRDLRSEMLVADLDTVVRRIEKVRSALKKPLPKPEREHDRHELALLERCQQTLESEESLRPLLEDPEEAALVSGFGFLTQKPAIVVLNIGEADVGRTAEVTAPLADAGPPVFAVCARAESEILDLAPEEQVPFLEDLGLRELQSDRLVHDVYRALDRVVFLTTNDAETRAWAVPRNTSAAGAAGAVHSDMARGFIRAEVVAFDDLRRAGSEKGVRAAGKFRLEGKDYLVQDGDILQIRFSV
jgi:GTP-binding protein YchF